MIQQVITCDICGTQKRQTNHWFVARAEAGELRISGWNSVHLMLPGAKHLCGETGAHKLISQFFMTLLNVDAQAAADKRDFTPAAETRIAHHAEYAEPSRSAWDGSQSTTGSARSSHYAPPEPERLHRCVGGRRS